MNIAWFRAQRGIGIWRIKYHSKTQPGFGTWTFRLWVFQDRHELENRERKCGNQLQLSISCFKIALIFKLLQKKWLAHLTYLLPLENRKIWSKVCFCSYPRQVCQPHFFLSIAFCIPYPLSCDDTCTHTLYECWLEGWRLAEVQSTSDLWAQFSSSCQYALWTAWFLELL